MIEGDEVVDRLRHEGMPLFREHEIIGNTNGYRFGEDNRKDEERIERTKAADVQVDVYASVVMENEISDCVGSLNGIGIGVESV